MQTTISILQMSYSHCQSHVDQGTAKLIATRQDSSRATSTPHATLTRAPNKPRQRIHRVRKGLASSLSLRSPNQSGSIQIPIPSNSTVTHPRHGSVYMGRLSPSYLGDCLTCGLDGVHLE